MILELSGTNQSICWLRTKHMLTYINDVIIPYTQNQPCLLILDTSTWHHDQSIIYLCGSNHIELLYVLDRCTGSCQPLDVGVLGPVKSSTNSSFYNKAKHIVQAHRRLSLKYECFVKAWEHVSRATVIAAWHKSGFL